MLDLLKKYISEQGYKSDSPDRNNPFNVILSNMITMKNVNHPVHGRDNLGNEKVMYPGEEYEFDGDYVVETPMKQAQEGTEVKGRIGTRPNPDGSVSSHLMKAEYLPERGWVGFPSLFQNEDSTWHDMSITEDKDWMKIYEEAVKRGEVYDFGEDKEKALAFGKGSWKKQEGGELGDHPVNKGKAEIKAFSIGGITTTTGVGVYNHNNKKLTDNLDKKYLPNGSVYKTAEAIDNIKDLISLRTNK